MGKSIYNIINVGDHALFSSSLVPMSLGEFYTLLYYAKCILNVPQCNMRGGGG